MQKNQFSKLVNLSSKSEIEKALYIAFYLGKIRNQEVFPINVLVSAMTEFGLNIPNQYRLKTNISKSRSFAKAGTGLFRISLKVKENLEVSYPSVRMESDEVSSDETIIPDELFQATRGYLERVVKQINASYQHNLFDGCAMLMRRLMEMMLILIYKHNARENEVRDGKGNYFPLSYIINYSISNRVLGLSKDSEEMLDDFRILGNYSAHGLEYSCKRADIKKVRIHYRACMEEMLYKAGLRR